ncbi:PP2C family protein-serine/threonine phosphatase [Mucilaginibacter psychrotolerans]|uniref:Serine/threonine-protein phosphatase n=1 Tax=Mucilaginibacter psychrotolerans TaxID=1524096 RepID=A0A4Y8SLL0_9SPHI|nr:protein phosphatase 2C domain-containing protein [Mucilaginibacter psychrotolerans]TFF39304.1 serine/threonine-protein phosphatase [Mucilaginibacter psychrotolerans]
MAENFFGLTDTGKVRSNNEDTFIAERLGSGLILAGVIDGVGGYNGGEVAAAIAREQISDYLESKKGEPIPAMIEAVKRANNAIAAKKLEEKELDSMACVATIALVDIANNQFYYAHVGDTRLYLLRDASLIKISKDHSFVGFLEDSGRLTEREAMDHPKRNEINKALGFGTNIDADDSFIETGQSPFLPGDMLLLCSDGLTDMVDKREITAIITQSVSLHDKAAGLIRSANKNGGHDNVTVALVQNDKASHQHTAIAPTVELKKNDEPAAQANKEYASAKAAINPDKQKAMPAKKGSFAVAILTILLLVSLGAAAYCYMQWQKEAHRTTKPLTLGTDTVRQKAPRNPHEIQLQNAINMAKGDTVTLIDTLFKQPIIISDTLDISKPRLYIKVKGTITLKCDTAYKGPAFSTFKGAKSVGFENIKLQGFVVGISTYNTDLRLKNVQFLNCAQPILRSFMLPAAKPINEGFPVTVLFADSTSKFTTTPNGKR